LRNTPLLSLSQARNQQKQAARMPIKLQNPLLGQDLRLQDSLLNNLKRKSLDEQHNFPLMSSFKAFCVKNA
jgi:hypothetical protein